MAHKAHKKINKEILEKRMQIFQGACQLLQLVLRQATEHKSSIDQAARRCLWLFWDNKRISLKDQKWQKNILKSKRLTVSLCTTKILKSRWIVHTYPMNIPKPVESKATDVTASMTNTTINLWLDCWTWSSLILGRLKGKPPVGDGLVCSCWYPGSLVCTRCLTWGMPSLFVVSLWVNDGLVLETITGSVRLTAAAGFSVESPSSKWRENFIL